VDNDQPKIGMKRRRPQKVTVADIIEVDPTFRCVQQIGRGNTYGEQNAAQSTSASETVSTPSTNAPQNRSGLDGQQDGDGRTTPVSNSPLQGVDTEESELLNDSDTEIPSFRILDEIKTRNDKFKIEHRIVHIELDASRENMLSVHAAIADLIDEEKQDANVNDFIGIVISPSTGGYDINIEFVRQTELSYHSVVAELSNVAQSNDKFFVNNRLTIEFIRVSDLRGKGQEEDNFKKASRLGHMVEIKNSVNKYLKLRVAEKLNLNFMCMLTAIVVGVDHKKFCASLKTTKDKSEWRDAKNQNSKKFAVKVQKLYDECNFDLTNGGSFAHLQAVEQVLKHYRIVVYDGRTNLSIRYAGYAGPETKTTIYLYYNTKEHHFSYITSIAAFLSKKFFCESCNKGVNNRMHTCTDERKKCRKCMTYCDAFKKLEANIKCSDCNINFGSLKCYEAHQDSGLCDKRKACNDCGYLFRVEKSAHICGSRFCINCQSYCATPHFCHMKVSRQSAHHKSTDMKTLVSFADFESTATTPYGTNAFEHKVNVAHIQTVCYKCRDIELELHEECDYCGGPRAHTIDNLDEEKDVVSEFLEYCSDKCARKIKPDGRLIPLKHHVLFFHYASGYDALLCLSNLLGNSDWHVESVIMNGRKIMQLIAENITTGVKLTIRDFYNLVPRSLASLPTAFNLSATIKKGEFPHCMNSKENYEFNEQKMPDLKFWDVDNLSEERRLSVIEWHASEDERLRRSGGFYNFKKEIRSYCAQDVTILRLCATAFRKRFFEFNVDCLLETFTCASLCSLVFRRNFYTPKSIGLIPSTGYRGLQSKEGLQFLLWREIVEGHTIQHAGRQKEVFLLGSKIDGYHETPEGEKIVYEYHGNKNINLFLKPFFSNYFNSLGCYWHFCPHCYPNEDAKEVRDKKEVVTGMERRLATNMRMKFLKEKGYKVVSMFGCEFKHELNRDPAMKEILKNHPLIKTPPLAPREALKGGRTNSAILYFKPSENQSVKYYDFTSL